MPLPVISLREISMEVNVQILFDIPYLMSVKMRSVIHFLCPRNLTIAEISQEVDDISGRSVPCLRTVQKLVVRFAADEEGLEDRPRSDRRRSDQNISLIAQLLVDDPYLSQKAITGILSIHQATVTQILLEQLSLRKVNFKWIAHYLNEGQKQERVRLSTEFLEFLEARAPKEFANVYTRNETLVCYDNPQSSM
jgi:hypothetical protein